jgi:MerR family transcriptional regulator, copper efflux regulator
MDEYSINDVSKKANVTIRTIRFYINEGLLPAPQTHGRYAVYTDEYLDRLELIRRLKNSFLPLKEIRATMTSLSWSEVQASLADLRKRDEDRDQASGGQVNGLPAHEAGESHSSALDYISGLLSSTPVSRPLPPQPAPKSAPGLPPVPPAPQPERWLRVTLADGVELHAREPLRPEDQKKIEQLIQSAKKIFSA